MSEQARERETDRQTDRQRQREMKTEQRDGDKERETETERERIMKVQIPDIKERSHLSFMRSLNQPSYVNHMQESRNLASWLVILAEKIVSLIGNCYST